MTITVQKEFENIEKDVTKKIDKYIELDDWTDYFKLSPKELQAINKQVEELWGGK